MLFDAVGDFDADPMAIEAAAVAAEAAGYDGLSVPETGHDAFVALSLAARATEQITLLSGIAVAFARNPMTIATLANDIALVSAGRFQIGLGSQVRAHIERRFGMPWSHPAARMEEFIRAVRAIWTAWETGERLNFTGEFYRHTLMTEFFSPGPNPYGRPPVLLAAVGERMTQVAGRVADGLICHSLTTEAYLREVTLPALRTGQADAGRADPTEAFEISLAPFVVVGATPADRAGAEAAVRRQIAFYASTPAYRPVLELHGWDSLGQELNRLSRGQQWDRMGTAIDDEVLAAFAVAGTPIEVAEQLHGRFGDLVHRMSFYTPYPADPADLADVGAHLRALPGTP